MVSAGIPASSPRTPAATAETASPRSGVLLAAQASRAATAFWGVYAAVFAMFAGQLGSLIEAVNIVGSLFYGAMLGVFVLAFAPWKTTGTGAFLGILCGLIAVAATQLYSDVTFLWFNVIGAAVTVSVGLVVSRLSPGSTRDAKL